MKKVVSLLLLGVIYSSVAGASDLMNTIIENPNPQSDITGYKKQYIIMGSGEKGSIKAIGNMLGRDLNEMNTFDPKYDSMGRITHFKAKNGYEYRINYNYDGSTEIKVVDLNSDEKEITIIKYNSNNQKVFEEVINDGVHSEIDVQPSYSPGVRNFNATSTKGNGKGSLSYIKNLLGPNDGLSKNSGIYTIKHDEHGRVSVLTYNGSSIQKPNIIRYNIIYNDTTTVIIGTGSSKQYDFSRTFRDNGKEIK